MKTIINSLLALMILGSISCISDEVGPQGPMGPQGPQGDQGPKGESGFVFEFEDVDFTSPDFEVFLSYPDDFEPLNSDVALVYLLWDVVEIDGENVEVWRQVPQTIVTENGILQYNFDFTMLDVRLFLDADFDASLLVPADTDDWVVRVVVVPGDFWSSSRIASGGIEYQDLKEQLKLPELPTPDLSIKRR